MANASSCSGKTVPQGMCALFFNEEDCGGQAYLVPIRHYTRLSDYRFAHFGPKDIVAESVLVRPGCKFIGKVDGMMQDF